MTELASINLYDMKLRVFRFDQLGKLLKKKIRQSLQGVCIAAWVQWRFTLYGCCDYEPRVQSFVPYFAAGGFAFAAATACSLAAFAWNLAISIAWACLRSSRATPIPSWTIADS